jgi:type II secretory pathway pseudopilin PulG
LELVLVLVILSIGAALLLPPLLRTQPRFQRVICQNNLRQIGQSFHLWAAEHDNSYPWLLTAPAEGSAGQTNGAPPMSAFAGQAWFQFAALSNELAAPKSLVCPSDTNRWSHRATGWGHGAGGFSHAAQRNRSLSYFAGLHASLDEPDSVLAGDRNVRVLGLGACRPGIPLAAVVRAEPAMGWTNGLHHGTGHLLHNDGRVELVSNSGMLGALDHLRRKQTETHWLIPGTEQYK